MPLSLLVYINRHFLGENLLLKNLENKKLTITTNNNCMTVNIINQITLIILKAIKLITRYIKKFVITKDIKLDILKSSILDASNLSPPYSNEKMENSIAYNIAST